MLVGEVVNLHYSEAVITFTAGDESHSISKVIATLLLGDDSRWERDWMIN